MSDGSLLPQLDPCGCCETGLDDPSISNRPGLSALSYRIGTHPTFLRRMLAALPGAPYPVDPTDPDRPLLSLTTRSEDDPSIALLDAWATVADVVTFYQERIANEGFLRTAGELRSVLELAREIGYELRPGVAASAYLAFTVETAAGAPPSAVVKVGTKVKSIPGQDQKPQTFETVEEITARAEWNAMRPRLSEPQSIVRGQKDLYVTGTATGLQPGDAILIVGDERIQYPGSERWDVRVLTGVESHAATDPQDQAYTRLSWEVGLGQDKDPEVDPAQESPKVYAFRLQASLFGHNAPDWRTMPGTVKQAYDADEDPNNPDLRKTQWPDFELPSTGEPVVNLDGAHPKVLSGTWLAFTKPGYVELYRVTEMSLASRTDFAITGRTTRVHLDASEHLSWFDRRGTVVYAQSEELEIAEVPVTAAVTGDLITIVPAVEDLQPDQHLMISGLPLGAAAEADPVNELATIKQVIQGNGSTTIQLVDELALEGGYDPATVTVCANVALATHGESVEEILGGGDGAVTFQRFDLKKNPLTFVSAPTPSGELSTLTVRVNGVAWSESPSLYGLGPRSQSYVVRIDDQQRTTVLFGDGQSGARLPTGQENVTSTYRSGLGPEGNVDAGSLSLLQIRPLGIRGVSNPLPASGGTAAETLDEARPNAPLTVLTLDRIVSLQDYEDFTRAFAGIAKAQATAIWTGEKFVVHVTVAGPEGVPVTSPLYDNLLTAIDSGRDAVQAVRVDTYRLVQFGATTQVLVDAAYVQADVFAAVQSALSSAFSFDSRSFGQPVTAAEVITVVQGVEGVVASSLKALYALDPAGAPPPEPLPLEVVLPSERASLEATDDSPPLKFAPAQLLLIDPARIVLEEMPPP